MQLPTIGNEQTPSFLHPCPSTAHLTTHSRFSVLGPFCFYFTYTEKKIKILKINTLLNPEFILFNSQLFTFS